MSDCIFVCVSDCIYVCVSDCIYVCVCFVAGFPSHLSSSLFLTHNDISLLGAMVELVGKTKLPYGHVPLMLYNGEVTLMTGSGKVTPFILDTHNFDEKMQDMHSDDILAALEKCNKLRR